MVSLQLAKGVTSSLPLPQPPQTTSRTPTTPPRSVSMTLSSRGQLGSPSLVLCVSVFLCGHVLLSCRVGSPRSATFFLVAPLEATARCFRVRAGWAGLLEGQPPSDPKTPALPGRWDESTAFPLPLPPPPDCVAWLRPARCPGSSRTPAGPSCHQSRKGDCLVGLFSCVVMTSSVTP